MLKFLQKTEMIGELESDVLGVLKEKGNASASDILVELQKDREIAYTTVSTTLDRLYKKRLVERKPIRGPGGTKFIFSMGKDERARTQIVENALDRLTSAFGETTYSALFKRLETLPDEELDRLRKQVDRAKRRKDS
jgi:predicted transcriptional regulator